MDEDKTIDHDDDTIEMVQEEEDEEEEEPSLMEIENNDNDENDIDDNMIEYIVEKLDDNEKEEIDEPPVKAPSKTLKEIVIPSASSSSPATTKHPIQIKVAGKPAPITKFSGIKSGSSGQIVIIKGQQPMRIAQTQGNHGFQIIKTSDGNIIQIRNKNASNSVPINTIKKLPQQIMKNTIGKIIYKGGSLTGNEQPIVLSTPQSTKTITTAAGSITPILAPKTISLSQAQQLGLIGNKMKQIVIGQKKTLQLIKPATKILPATVSGTTNSNVLTNVIRKVALPQLQPKLAIQAINKTDMKKPIYQNIIKMTNQNNATVQELNSGKRVQYVRFVSIAGSTSTTSTTSTVTAGKISQGKILSTLPSGQQKILIQGKTGQTVAVIQKPTNSTGQTKIMTMATVQPKQFITNKSITPAISTQKKIFSMASKPNENMPKLIAVVKKEDKSNMVMSGQKITTLTQLQLSQLQGTSVIPGNNKNPPIVMLPSNFIQQLQLKNNNIKRKEESKSPSPAKLKKENEVSDEDESFNKSSPLSDDLRRKPCNCTKSQCLKLYCDCFANGEFCQNCNCKKCYNNLDNEDLRQKAIRICLERNPNAFRPKIGKAKDHNDSLRRHNKGCNCKRSGCLKNYCECYEAKISCSGNCKCIDCRNTEDYVERDSLESDVRISKRSNEETLQSGTNPNPKQPYNFMTPDVIDATIQCMIAQADECQRTGISMKHAEKMILEEFGRCLVEIIDFSIRNTDND